MTKEKFYIGLIIEGEYPDGLIDWVNNREPDTTIIEIEPKEDGTRRFEVVEVIQPVPTPEEEAERIAKLTMTPLDFINFLVSTGLTLEEINYYLETHLDVKMQLTYCSNVYCGVACSLMPIEMGEITITADMVIYAFRKKYGEIVEEEPTNEVE